MGKHARSYRVRSHRKPGFTRRAAASASAAAVGAVTAGAVAVSAHSVPAGVPVAAQVPVPAADVVVQKLHFIPSRPPQVVVRGGDSLSGIAGQRCGPEGDWTGIYVRNEKVIGSDPGFIRPGQVLVLDCRVVDVPVVATASYVQRRVPRHARVSPVVRAAGGSFSFSGLEALWTAAGGPAWAAPAAASVAECESGGNSRAYNPSGASGLWQILGEVVAGDVFDPVVNARNAVAKFRASGDTWAQWVCKPR